MSTKGASDYLGVNLRTLYRFIDEGDLAAYKFGRVIRLKEDDVIAFVERSRIPPGSLEHLHAVAFADQSGAPSARMGQLYPEPVRTDGR
jgi:excisionase family DNA binding protein